MSKKTHKGYVAIDDIDKLTEAFKELNAAKKLHDDRIRAANALDKIEHQTTLFDEDDDNSLLEQEKVRLELSKESLERAKQLKAEIKALKEERANISRANPIQRETASAPVKPQEAHNPVIITAMICIAIVMAIAAAS